MIGAEFDPCRRAACRVVSKEEDIEWREQDQNPGEAYYENGYHHRAVDKDSYQTHGAH
jgi:hypothetical protein